MRRTGRSSCAHSTRHRPVFRRRGAGVNWVTVETSDPSAIARRIAELRSEHRALDERIPQLAANPDDDLEAKRLKKRKLQLKDCIAKLESMLIPDELA